MDHRTFIRKGGRARSTAKTKANRAKAAAYWGAVRSGERPAPRRTMPPSPDGIADLPSEDCQLRGIARLEAFGSIARGEARRGSDVDLLAPFASNPGLSFYSMEDG